LGAVAGILVIDNYDSFVYNLVQYLQQLGARCMVARNDAMTVDDVERLARARDLAGILLSPGPGVPAGAGISEELVRWAARTETPLLGVCLGHQAIAEVYGGTVDRAATLMHGRTSLVHHDATGIFAGLPDPLTATRYHSLAVVEGTVPDVLEVTARADGGEIMGLMHRAHRLAGVQFHPESVLSQGGHRLLANWLTVCGYDDALGLVPPLEAEVERQRQPAG
jgi:para-aminobenzoate synthetase component 2